MRSAKDVMQDLLEESTNDRFFDNQALGSVKQKLIPLGFVLAALLIRLLLSASSLTGLIVSVLFAFGLGVLTTAYLKGSYKRQYKYNINFYLPLIMERLVMAVQAGLDIMPAIGAILNVEKNKLNSKQVFNQNKLDPVSELLSKVKNLTDSGLSFEVSLRQVAESVESSPLRHAFIHLATAYKEGGELVLPLRELSDSTQLFYQESIEEEIAKMPVKATMPLLLTFAGLILCFITSPVIQIMEVMRRALP